MAEITLATLMQTQLDRLARQLEDSALKIATLTAERDSARQQSTVNAPAPTNAPAQSEELIIISSGTSTQNDTVGQRSGVASDGATHSMPGMERNRAAPSPREPRETRRHVEFAATSGNHDIMALIVDPHVSILCMGPPLASAAAAILSIAHLGSALFSCLPRAHGARHFFFPPRAQSARRFSARRAALLGAWRFSAPPGTCASPPRRPSKRPRDPRPVQPVRPAPGPRAARMACARPVRGPYGLRQAHVRPVRPTPGPRSARTACARPMHGPFSLRQAHAHLPCRAFTRSRPVLAVLGFGGGEYGGDGCVQPPLILLLLLCLPLLQLPLRGVDVWEPSEWY
ncbi:unnamed protein product [Closterium sp. NIES-54]